MKSLYNKIILLLFLVFLLVPLVFWQITSFPPKEDQVEIKVEPETITAIEEPSGELPLLIPPTPETTVTPEETVAPEEQVKAEPPPIEERWVIHEIQPGDTLSTIFSSLEIGTNTLYAVINSGNEGKEIERNLRPGQQLLLRFKEGTGKLDLLIHEVNLLKSVQFDIADDTAIATVLEKDVEKRIKTASGTITSSLFLDGQKAGLSDRTIVEMAGLFNFDIDFAREIQPGDYFSVIYEAKYIDGEFFGNGNILAAEFINTGKSFRVVRFENDGRVDYFNEKGQSRKKSFIRTPLNFARISSKFTKSRYHPVLKRWRSHKGVDYAAKTGTPVWATGNGTVKRIEKQQGYGKVIYLQHGNKYTTVYGHLNGFKRGLKKGDKVKQGEVIGYVGQTGLATGPHLHYEFRINDKHVDPLSHKLPASDPIDGKKMAQFKKAAAPLLQKLDQLKAPVIAGRP
jgi:murein DD-endopeptidase MepM/ murein hydrolase activator NlpD